MKLQTTMVSTSQTWILVFGSIVVLATLSAISALNSHILQQGLLRRQQCSFIHSRSMGAKSRKHADQLSARTEYRRKLSTSMNSNPIESQSQEIEKLQLKAKSLKLQSEKLKLEAERDALLMKQEANAALLVELQRNLTAAPPEIEQEVVTSGPVLGTGPELVLQARKEAEVEIANPFKRGLQQGLLEGLAEGRNESMPANKTENCWEEETEELAERLCAILAMIEKDTAFGFGVFKFFIKWILGIEKDAKTAEELKPLLIERMREKGEDSDEVRRVIQIAVPAMEEAMKASWNFELNTTIASTNIDEEVYTIPSSMNIGNESNIGLIKNELESAGANAIYNRTVFPDSKQLQDQVYVKRVFPNPMDITSDEIDILKNEVFGKDSFYVNTISKFETAVIFEGLPQTFIEQEGGVTRGKREIDYLKLYDVIQEKLERSSVASRCRLYLVRDPREVDPDEMDIDMLLKEITEGKEPVFIATTAEASLAEPTGARSYVLATLAFLGAITLSANFAVQPFGTMVPIPDTFAVNDLEILIEDAREIVSYVIAFQALVFTIKRLTAALSGTKVGLPFVLPAYHIGSYGTWMPFKSSPRSSNTLYDFAISGPLTGFVLAIGLILVGTSLTATAPSSVLQTFPVVPAQIFQESFVIGKLVQSIIPTYLSLPDASETLVFMHPAAIAGMVGIYSTACTMFPFGRTDGGRALKAAWGRDVATVVQFFSTILLIIPAILGNVDTVLFYTIFLQFTDIKEPDLPSQNELDEPGQGKKILHGVLTLLAFLCFVPNPVKSFLETGNF